VSSAGGVTPSTPGTQIDHGISMNEFGLIDATKRERVAKELDTGWLTFTTDNTEVKYRVFRNFTLASVSAVASALPSTAKNDLSVGWNEFKLMDGTATQRVTASGYGSWPYSPASGYDYRQIALDRTGVSGDPEYVMHRSTWATKYFALKHQAWGELAGGCAGTWDEPKKVEERYWEVKVVTKIEQSLPYVGGGRPSAFATVIDERT
jgi:hypothetical protein